MLKERSTYEIMVPEDVGISGTDLVLGKHSGRHAFKSHMSKLGFSLSTEELARAYDSFIVLADKKKAVYDDDLIAIVQEQVYKVPQVYVLKYLHVSTGMTTVPTATVRLEMSDEVFEDAACGDGPVDAALKTIDRISGIPGKVLDFSLQAITGGKDAVGEVSMRVEYDGEVVAGKGSSTDIVEAGTKAYLNCLNRYLFTRDKKTGPGKRTAGKAAKKKGSKR
jgi:2-isopropylmalate synthase